MLQAYKNKLGVLSSRSKSFSNDFLLLYIQAHVFCTDVLHEEDCEVGTNCSRNTAHDRQGGLQEHATTTSHTYTHTPY